MRQRPPPLKFGSIGASCVDNVAVAPCRVRPPDLDQLAAERLAVGAEQPAREQDPLAERLAVVLSRQVVVELADRPVSERRARELRQVCGMSTSGSFGACSRVPT